MAGNEWINGYLEAILDTGAGFDDHRTDQRLPTESRESGGFNATKYFVEEVVSGFDETDIHRTWMKATATRDAKERSARLENLCWRIWHITRKKKQIELDNTQRVARQTKEREKGHKDAAEDLDDLLEEAKPVAPLEAALDGGSEEKVINKDSQQQLSWDQPKQKKLYLVLISLHGLVRGINMELGRDSDTGGQVKYVVELARALARMPEVYRVDLLTRQISAPEVDWSYGEPTEMLSTDSYEGDEEEVGESSGAYIVRIPCGPRDKYLRKELLWPHIQEFVDGALAHILNMTKVLGEQISSGAEPVWPHVIHGHYADAGDIASLLSGALNVPMVLTGHSLGRNKLEQLVKQGRQSKEDINAAYKIMRRIEAEELSLDAAELVVTSTRQEIDEQWGLYDGFDVKLEKKIRARVKQGLSCNGRYMPRMVVIPPGMDFSNVVVQDTAELIDGEADGDGTLVSPMSPPTEPTIWSEIMRFFTNPHKPMILALARPDPKKNMTTLVKAFGECRPLRELANLTLVMGNRDDIDEMSGGNANVLTTVLKLIDKYDLYGQVAYPKHHKQSDVPDIYRLAAKTKGVFINPALVEPFGLTLIEAAAHGLPMVATKNGGPVDIHRTLGNGLLVDPHDQEAIANALLKLLADRNLWVECRRNGLKNIHLYSWPAHCKTYLSRVALCRMRQPQWQNTSFVNGDFDADSQGDSLRDAQDISLRLSDDGERYGSVNNSLLRNNNGNSERLKQAFERHKLGRRESSQDDNEPRKIESNDKAASTNGTSANRPPQLRRRRRLFVIAVDADQGMIKILSEIFKAVKFEAAGRSTGFVLSTSLTVSETVSMLNPAGISVQEFDALICSSGSEVYYPSGQSASEDCSHGQDIQLSSDADYETHIDYRWGGQGLKKALSHLALLEDYSGETENGSFVVEDPQTSNSHCLAYTVKVSSKAPKVDELRHRLRLRGLRGHVMYCQNGTKLHVIPLLASRSQALRYMFVRWGLDVANMYVFVGETGDTDYEELLAGMHKTIILKGVVQGTSEHLLRSSGSYAKEDIVPSDSPNIVSTEGVFGSDSILEALRKLG